MLSVVRKPIDRVSIILPHASHIIKVFTQYDDVPYGMGH